MKRINKILTVSALSVGVAELISEVNAMFETIFAGGSKSNLAKCADLSKEEKIVKEDNENERENRIKWKRKSRYTRCYVRGFDNTPLYCQVYLQKGKSQKWVVALHGYGGWGDTLDYAAQKFYDKGYNVVLPDLRGHGKSGGKYIGMGQLDSRDIINIISLIVKGDASAEIYLFGVSMGGAAALMTASEKLPDNVKAVISDCSFDNANSIIAYELRHSFKLPSFPVVNIMDFVCIKKAKYDLRLASPIDRVGYINVPVLFIHGDSDGLVPTKMVYRLYKKARCKKALMIVKDAGHGVSALVDSKRYWRGVFGFIEGVKKETSNK